MDILPKGFFVLIFLFCFLPVDAQYFQQEVNCTIHVTLNDRSHELSASELIHYKNNSEATLNELYFHLYPAAYKDRSTVLAKEIFLSGDNRMLVAKEKALGNIDSLDFRVNDETVKWSTLTDTADVCRIVLNKPLMPGDSITITTPFRVKIPSAELSRLGHTGQAYFITQWFPKPAVFDKNGWNYFPYLDQGEYYSEFGSFDVYVTLPENYRIAATGMMIDAEKEFAWLEGIDSLTRGIKEFPQDDSTPPSSKVMKTIHFRQDKVHDFAWFADKRWHVLRDTASSNGKLITTWSFFNNNEAKYWLHATEYMRDAIRYYTQWAGGYPYDQMTAVDVGYATGNGMEYPMITAIGNYGDPFDFEVTLIHEVAHNWFYGILGSNERCHPWMDEGMTNFFETRYVYTKYKNDSTSQEERSKLAYYDLTGKTNSLNHRKRQYYSYLFSARRNSDQSPDLCSEKINNTNYKFDTYYKTALSFNYLKSYLGDGLFDTCMRAYYDEWKFKHPMPKDIEEVFERVSKRNLDWMFDDLLNSTKKLDYKIECAKFIGNDSVEITLKNNGEISGPVAIQEMNGNNTSATYWLEGFQGENKIKLPGSACDKIMIDAEEIMPELSERNNSIRMHGMFRKTEKLKFSIGLHPENRRRTEINFAPVLGWNNYSNLMPGVLVHNISFHEKKFEYNLMPMYGTMTKDLVGVGTLRYHIYPRTTLINKVSISSSLSRYDFGDDSYDPMNGDADPVHRDLRYTKLDNRIVFSLMQKNRQEKFKSEFMLRNIVIKRDLPHQVNYSNVSMDFIYWQAEYKRINTNPLKKSLQKVGITFGEGFFYAAGELQNFFSYGPAGKGFSSRIFAGVISIPHGNTWGIDYRMNLSGKNGLDDYLFDEIFLGRSETSEDVLGSQFVNDYAGFKAPTSFYRLAEEWMTGINISTTLPGFIPFRLFANVGSFDKASDDGRFGSTSLELGVDLPIIRDVFIIYLPFAYSSDIKSALESQDFNVGETIRFELHFDLLNPFNKIKNIYNE